MKYVYTLSHTMGPCLCADGSMTEDYRKALQFVCKEDAAKYLQEQNLDRFLFVQTFICEES